MIKVFKGTCNIKEARTTNNSRTFLKLIDTFPKSCSKSNTITNATLVSDLIKNLKNSASYFNPVFLAFSFNPVISHSVSRHYREFGLIWLWCIVNDTCNVSGSDHFGDINKKVFDHFPHIRKKV